MSIQVRVNFTNETPLGDYSDCLVYELADFFNPNGTRKITNAELRDTIQVRTAAWKETVRVARERVTPERTLEQTFGEDPDTELAKVYRYLKRNRPELLATVDQEPV